MKAIAYILIILLLGAIAFFQFQKHKRFHPPVDYEYTMNQDIDKQYHDPSVVKKYFSNSVEIGAFARKMWRTSKIDVRFPNDKKPLAVWAADKYSALFAETKYLEDKLIESQRLKKEGFDNQQIIAIEKSGEDPKKYLSKVRQEENDAFLYQYLSAKSLRKGNTGQEVMELQKLIKAAGIQLKVDGKFSSDTEIALKSFQEKNQLYQSGTLNPPTLKLLLEAS